MYPKSLNSNASLNEYLPIVVTSLHAISRGSLLDSLCSISFPSTNTEARFLRASYRATICVHIWGATTGAGLNRANVARDGLVSKYNQVRWPWAISNRSSPVSPFMRRIGWMPEMVCKLTQTEMVIASVTFANFALLNCTTSTFKFAKLLHGASATLTSWDWARRMSWLSSTKWAVALSNPRCNSGLQQPVKEEKPETDCFVGIQLLQL